MNATSFRPHPCHSPAIIEEKLSHQHNWNTSFPFYHHNTIFRLLRCSSTYLPISNDHSFFPTVIHQKSLLNFTSHYFSKLGTPFYKSMNFHKIHRHFCIPMPSLIHLCSRFSDYTISELHFSKYISVMSLPQGFRNFQSQEIHSYCFPPVSWTAFPGNPLQLHVTPSHLQHWPPLLRRFNTWNSMSLFFNPLNSLL